MGRWQNKIKNGLRPSDQETEAKSKTCYIGCYNMLHNIIHNELNGAAIKTDIFYLCSLYDA